MILLVGLGNPGSNYSHTRHNAGFMAVDAICNHYHFSSPKRKFSSDIAEGDIEGVRVIALKPHTYMNNSGIAVREASHFYKIPLDDILVCHDDLDLPLGKIKVKKGGGHGGHNGLKSIDAHLGKEYWRLRIGIGHPGDRNMVSDYVLSRFTASEEKEMIKTVGLIADNVFCLIEKDTQSFYQNLSLI